LIVWFERGRLPGSIVGAGPELASARPDSRFKPVLFVQAFDAVGEPTEAEFTVQRLRTRVADGLSGYDWLRVVVEAGPDRPPELNQYRFGGTVFYHPDGSFALDLRLVDTSDGIQFWAREIEQSAEPNGKSTTLEEKVRELAANVAAPFGVVWAREASAHSDRDPLRACIFTILDYWRQFDPDKHATTRACADKMYAADPSNSQALLARALVNYRAYLLDMAGDGAVSPIDQALVDAQRADELKPDVARTYELLSAIWFSRGDLARAFAAADKSLALKPHDALMIGEYGARLVAIGQVERGMTMLLDSVSRSAVHPELIDFHLFLGAYLKGDAASAAQYAVQIRDGQSPFSLLARALSARMSDDPVRGKQAIDRLVAVTPNWASDPRGQIAKYFPAAAVRDRLLGDLVAVGLPAPK
jgi:tetratricopeptide (TPR) repeat protein